MRGYTPNPDHRMRFVRPAVCVEDGKAPAAIPYVDGLFVGLEGSGFEFVYVRGFSRNSNEYRCGYYYANSAYGVQEYARR